MKHKKIWFRPLTYPYLTLRPITFHFSLSLIFVCTTSPSSLVHQRREKNKTYFSCRGRGSTSPFLFLLFIYPPLPTPVSYLYLIRSDPSPPYLHSPPLRLHLCSYKRGGETYLKICMGVGEACVTGRRGRFIKTKKVGKGRRLAPPPLKDERPKIKKFKNCAASLRGRKEEIV